MVFLVDLDGTLLNAEGKLEIEDIKRIKRIQKEGHTIVICTGRTEKEAQSIIQDLEIEKYKGLAILADGQYIIDYKINKVIQLEFLCDKDVMAIYTKCPQYKNRNIQLFCKDRNYRIVNSIISPVYFKTKVKRYLGNKKDNTRVLTKRALAKTRIQQIEKMTITSGNDVFSNIALLNEFEIYYVHDKKRFEIKHKGVNKASATLIALHNRNAYTYNIIAFGNDDNDICLFKIANESYAVANATEKLKDEANYILDPISSAVTQKMLDICMKEM